MIANPARPLRYVESAHIANGGSQESKVKRVDFFGYAAIISHAGESELAVEKPV